MKNRILSIIVLSYNTQNLLKQCLDSIVTNTGMDQEDKGDKRDKGEKNDDKLKIELIIVDNGSTDGSVAEIQKSKIKYQNQNLKFKIILNKENLGFAKGNNQGLKIAQGEYILFLNSDTIVYEGALDEAVTFMEANETVGALSAKTLLRNGKIDPDCHRGFPSPLASITFFLGLEKAFPKSRLFGQYHQYFLDLNTNHEIDAGAGAFMLIRREIVKTVGVFDENYFFYGEDLDYFYRIKQAGWKVMFYAKPLLTHYKGASSGLRKESSDVAKNPKSNRLKVARASIKAMEIFYRKFYQNKYPSILTYLVIQGIKFKGMLRVLKYQL